jgi:hypothetical protein
MVMELPKSRDERELYENKILSNQNYGKGVIYKGGYYYLDYRAHTPNVATLHCEGVVLTIRRNKDQSPDDFAPVVVPYDKEVRFIDGLKGTPILPFKARLKIETNIMIQKIKDHDEHVRRVNETADNVVACKMKIDDIMSEITDGQAVSYAKMIEEQEKLAALPEPEHITTQPLNNIQQEEPVEEPVEEKPNKDLDRICGEIWVAMKENKKQNQKTIPTGLPDKVNPPKMANDIVLNAQFRVI